jgi:hypothetical protein
MLNHPVIIRESLVGLQRNVIREEETVHGVGGIGWIRSYGYCAGCIEGTATATALIFVLCEPQKWFLWTPEKVTSEPWKEIEWEERGGFIEVNKDLCP